MSSVQSHSSNNQSYSSALNKNAPTFPTKKQAILFNALDDTKLEEYLVALGEIIEPRNILFSSRLSNNRICIYLSSESLVDQFISQSGEINVKNEILRARKLITPSERLLLSNVCPSIPHNIIEDELKKLGIKQVSPLTFLKISSQLPEFQHVLSFRRQTYIQPLENVTLPESFLITYEQTSYRIFISLDKPSCFICKQPDHFAPNCPNKDQLHNTPNPSTSVITPSSSQPSLPTPSPSLCTPPPVSQNTPSSSTQPSQNSNPSAQTPQITVEKSKLGTPVIPTAMTQNDETQMETELSTNKRNISELDTTPSPDQENEEPTFKIPKPRKKSRHNADPLKEKSIQEMMLPTKTLFDNPSHNFVLTYDQTTDFFENCSGSKDILSLIKTYTTDIPDFLDMLTKLRPFFTDKSIKTKCTKMKNKINRLLDTDPTPDPDSDASCSSQETVENP